MGRSWLDDSETLFRFLTGGALCAILYGIGYIAVNRGIQTLGLAGSPGAEVYVRAGYSFVIDSSRAAFEFGMGHPWRSVGAVLVAAGLLSSERWSPRLLKRRTVFVAVWSVLVLLAVLTALYSIKAALEVVGGLAAESILVQPGVVLMRLPQPAQWIMQGLSHPGSQVLSAFYRSIVGRWSTTVGMVVALVVAARAIRRLSKFDPPWLSAIQATMATFILLPLLLLPAFYGVCYLSVRPLCVTVTPQGADPYKTGWMLTNLDSPSSLVQLLVTEANKPTRLLLFEKTKVRQIDLETAENSCEALLPIFAALPITSPYQ